MARDPDPSPAPNAGTAIWGWNGTEWEAVLVDTDGHLLLGTVGISEDNKAQVVYESGDILYVCKAAIGSLKASAVWQIKKVDGMDMTWCDGNALYDNVATSLAIVELLSFS